MFIRKLALAACKCCVYSNWTSVNDWVFWRETWGVHAKITSRTRKVTCSDYLVILNLCLTMKLFLSPFLFFLLFFLIY